MTGEGERREKRPDRAEAQSNRILDAAEKCFIKDGFHSATVANISEEAGVSAGLIYRYFENKNAIILAIIERQLQEQRENIRNLQSDADLAGRLGVLLRSWKERAEDVMNPVLFFEMSAEAGRDPEIARALEEADRLFRTDFRKWLEKIAAERGKKPSTADLERRALVLQCLVEGLALRTVREPGVSCETLNESVEWILPWLLSFEQG